jgi:hypothetical protein
MSRLDGARIKLQVDIGFGDVVTPAPLDIAYPTLLDDVDAPALRAYPKATVVAEKLHAISVLGMTNSRMKDFFDLWFLLRDGELDPVELRRAIAATFLRRKTDLPRSSDIAFSDAFAQDATKQTQWRAFVSRNRLLDVGLLEIVRFLRSRLPQLGIE